MKLFEDTFKLTDEGIRIQNEFEDLVKPFFEKYRDVTNPIEFDWLVTQPFEMQKCANYVKRVTNLRSNI
jgi:hypothetical protein